MQTPAADLDLRLWMKLQQVREALRRIKSSNGMDRVVSALSAQEQDELARLLTKLKITS